MAKIKSETKSQRDSLREASPHYAALLERQAQILARQEELKKQIGGNRIAYVTTTDAGGNVVDYKVEESLGAEAGRHRSWSSEAPRPTPKPQLRHAGGAALLKDLLPPQSEEELSPAPLPPEWPHQDLYREICREQEDITAALQMLTPEIEAARKEHSQRLGSARTKEYSALVESAVDRAIEFCDAILALFEFTNEARYAGIERKDFRALNLQSFDISAGHHPLRLLIADAVEKKHVPIGKLRSCELPAPIELLHL